VIGAIAMKVVAFNGSARKDGNTAILVRYVFEELEKEGIKTELVQLAGKKIHGCKACFGCFKTKNKKCVFDDDIVNNCIQKIFDADAIILASPVYFANMSSELKALIDRVGFVQRANGNMFKRKVGAPVIAVRRAGAVFTHDAINHFFFISEMVVPGSSYWNMGFGLNKEDVRNDKEGETTMRDLGKNMAWLLKCIEAGRKENTTKTETVTPSYNAG
jgi:multimeric flavodoxin WrbA